MSHLSSAVADSGFRLPESNMADVIDALKRLERLGSESSKATQKLIEAAALVESRIVEQFAAFDDVIEFPGTAYEIRDGKLYNAPGERVSFDRGAALTFAADIAGGLLDVIVEELARLRERDDAATKIFDRAIADLDERGAQ